MTRAVRSVTSSSTSPSRSASITASKVTLISKSSGNATRQWAAVSTTVGAMRVPVQIWNLAPSGTVSTSDPTLAYLPVVSGVPNVIAPTGPAVTMRAAVTATMVRAAGASDGGAWRLLGVLRLMGAPGRPS